MTIATIIEKNLRQKPAEQLRVVETIREHLSAPSSEKILNLLKENNKLSTLEIAAKLCISSRAVEKHIAILKNKNCLKRIGSDKGGYWEVLES